MHPLESLIHSLDQAERRYFTVQAKRHVMGKKNSYLKLFEAIVGKAAPDDETLKKIVPAEQLASQKHYLFQMILKAMRGYESGKGSRVILREWLQDIAYLESKCLYGPCAKLLAKAKKLAAQFERFQDTLVLLEIERRLVKVMLRDRLAESLAQIDRERMEAMRRLDVQYQYIELYDRLFTQVRQQYRLERQSALETISKLMQLPLLAVASHPTSFHAKSYFHLCTAYCHQLKGDFEQAQQSYEANIAHWDAQPQWAKEEPYQFQRALSNYLALCHTTQQTASVPQILQRMATLQGHTFQERAEHFSNYHFFHFHDCMNAWRFEEAIQNAPEIEKGLLLYGDIMPDSRRIIFIYNLMVMFLFLGQSKEALKWLNKLIHGDKSEARQDAQRAARIFLLMLHYDLCNLDLYDHLFPMVQRYLKPYGTNAFEQQMLDFLKALYRGGGLAWPRPEAQALTDTLEALTQAHSDAHYPGIREAIIWLRARTEGRAMVDVGRES
jgi:hypothetical protein